MAEQALEPVPINSQPSEAIEDRLQCFFLVALLVCVVGCSSAASERAGHRAAVLTLLIASCKNNLIEP